MSKKLSGNAEYGFSVDTLGNPVPFHSDKLIDKLRLTVTGIDYPISYILDLTPKKTVRPRWHEIGAAGALPLQKESLSI